MKKYIGYGGFFCWHCGRRQVVGRYKCPHCGASYNHPETTSTVKFAVRPKTALGNLHPSILRYHIKYIVASIIFGILWSVIVMYWISDVKDTRVYVLIWAFWIIWLIGHLFHDIIQVRKSQVENRVPGPTVVCGCCGTESHRRANYCDRCGSLILKPSTAGELRVDPDMNTVGITPTHTKDGKRRKKKKRDWGMTFFWIFFIGATLFSMYYAARH